jgi:hypothetical protein
MRVSRRLTNDSPPGVRLAFLSFERVEQVAGRRGDDDPRDGENAAAQGGNARPRDTAGGRRSAETALAIADRIDRCFS